MKSTHRLSAISQICVASTLGLSMALTLGLPASYAVGDPDMQSQTSPSDSVLSTSMKTAKGTTAVFVQFKGEGAYEATQPSSVLQGKKNPVSTQAEVARITQTVESQSQQIASQSGSQLLYTTHNALRGAAIIGDAKAIRTLANHSDVARISPIVAKTANNSSSDITTQALSAWEQTGHTGKNVKIAVVDTGIDYTHTDFGGPGTDAAYEQASKLTDLPDAQSGLIDRNKVIGGYDLAGDSYDGHNTPSPDNNPLDCKMAGHGTHVAGTAAGYGVKADGTTFKGDYKTLTSDDVLKMKIGPGSAPEAQLLAFRVFGCTGQTELLGQALDRTLDPNGDGDFSDKVDIVNLSLGSDFGAADDPDNTIVNALTRQGILSVLAAGNANGFKGEGDTYSNLGSPGNAISALTVANSLGAYASFDKAQVTAPSNIAGDVKGDYTVNYAYSRASATDLTGQVVMAPADNRFACNAFDSSVDFKGKWVFIDWAVTPDTFPCGSKVRFDNLAKAGAKGVVLASAVNAESVGIAGNATIPGIRLSKSDADKVRPAAEAGTLTITLNKDWRGTILGESGKVDQLNSSSARGQHGSESFTKPDVAAPGTNIVSAGVGLGNDSATMTGTSMSTPHVAGIAALVKEAHPNYTPANIKAAIMNTATHDIKTADGIVYSVERVGSGRIDALAAVNQEVFVYNSDSENLVSLSFGVAEVEAGSSPLVLNRNMSVQNSSVVSHTYKLSIDQSVTMPGVTLSVDPSVTVAPGQTAKFKVTATVDPTQLAKTYDPALAKKQLEQVREYIASASGRIILTENNKTLRVPVQIAPKPVSKMTAEADFTSLAKADTTATVKLTGTELNQGGYKSLVGAFELGAVSKRIQTGSYIAASAQTSDLQYVGAYSNAQELAENGKDSNAGILAFGVSTWANWDTITSTSPVTVEIDTNKDGVADARLVTENVKGLDYPIAQLYKVVNGKDTVVATNPVNGSFGDLDTNTMDSNAMVLPVSLADLGLTKDNAVNIQYRVSTSSNYVTSDIADTTDWITYNPFAPNVAISGGEKVNDVLYSDTHGQSLTLKSNGKGLGVLFLHMHNATGDLTGQKTGEDGGKAQVALFTQPTEVVNPLTQKVVDPHFTDVNQSTPFYKEISWLASRGITRGWDDGTYRPNSDVSRGVMAAFFYRMAGSPQFTAPTISPFTDVPSTHPFYKEISWMASQGITRGWPDGTFKPEAPVQRDAMAAFFYRFAGSPEFTTPAHSPFVDVNSSTIFYKEIAWMNTSGISTGWDDGTYRPLIAIHRDAMAAFIYRYTDKVVNAKG